jgi:hypothetical protein
VQSDDYYRIFVDGTVIDGWDFVGQVEINADNVTIKNSRIRCSDACVSMMTGHKGLTLSHLDIGPDSGWGQAGTGVLVAGNNSEPGADANILEYLHIHNVDDGLRADGNLTLRYSYIHALDMTGGGAHSDGSQTTGWAHMHFIGNTIEGGNTSTFLVQRNSSNGIPNPSVSDFIVDGNWLLGRYESSSGEKTSYAINVAADACDTDCGSFFFRNNHLNRTWDVGPDGSSYQWTPSTWYGNTYVDDSSAVPVP